MIGFPALRLGDQRDVSLRLLFVAGDAEDAGVLEYRLAGQSIRIVMVAVISAELKKDVAALAVLQHAFTSAAAMLKAGDDDRALEVLAGH